MAVRVVGLALVLAAWASAAHGSEGLNWFEWTAVAPIVARGESLGTDGRYTVLHVDAVLRGDLATGGELLIDTRLANRDRDRDRYARPLRMEQGSSFLVLLEDAHKVARGNKPVFRLVRGIGGARAAPAEGGPALQEALETFIQIQSTKSDRRTWEHFSRLLEDSNNSIVLEVALDQFLKFRRAEPGLLPVLVPLLDHPLPTIRTRVTRLVGQVVEIHGDERVPDEDALRSTLFARVRRDPARDVRIAGVEALRGFRDPAAVELLEEIADEDPDQMVRYLAERLLLEHQRSAVGRGAEDDR